MFYLGLKRVVYVFLHEIVVLLWCCVSAVYLKMVLPMLSLICLDVLGSNASP